MMAFLAIVGQQTLGKKDQGAIVGYEARPDGTDPDELAQLQRAFVDRMSILPTGYAGPASLASGDVERPLRAFRVGVFPVGRRAIAYFGQFTFARFAGNDRGLTPFGIGFGIVLHDGKMTFGRGIIAEIQRIFECYRADALNGQHIYKPISAYQGIKNKWDIVAERFLPNPSERELPYFDGVPSDHVIETFIANRDGASDLPDIVGKLQQLMTGTVQFDAFVALDSKLDAQMAIASNSHTIKYLTVDDFVNSALARNPAPSEIESTAAAMPPRAMTPAASSRPLSTTPEVDMANPETVQRMSAEIQTDRQRDGLTDAVGGPLSPFSSAAVATAINDLASTIVDLATQASSPRVSPTGEPAVVSHKALSRRVARAMPLIGACSGIAALVIVVIHSADQRSIDATTSIQIEREMIARCLDDAFKAWTNGVESTDPVRQPIVQNESTDQSNDEEAGKRSAKNFDIAHDKKLIENQRMLFKQIAQFCVRESPVADDPSITANDHIR